MVISLVFTKNLEFTMEVFTINSFMILLEESHSLLTNTRVEVGTLVPLLVVMPIVLRIPPPLAPFLCQGGNLGMERGGEMILV